MELQVKGGGTFLGRCRLSQSLREDGLVRLHQSVWTGTDPLLRTVRCQNVLRDQHPIGHDKMGLEGRSNSCKAKVTAKPKASVAEACELVSSDSIVFLQGAGLSVRGARKWPEGFHVPDRASLHMAERPSQRQTTFVPIQGSCGGVKVDGGRGRHSRVGEAAAQDAAEIGTQKKTSSKQSTPHRAPSSRSQVHPTESLDSLPKLLLEAVPKDQQVVQSKAYNLKYNEASISFQPSDGSVEGIRLKSKAYIEERELEKLVNCLELCKENGVAPQSICTGEEVLDLLAHEGSVSLALRCLAAFPQSGALYSHAMQIFPQENLGLFWKALIQRIQQEGEMPPPRNYDQVAKTLVRLRAAEFVDFVCAFRATSLIRTRDFCNNEVVFQQLARDQDMASALKFLHGGVRRSRLGTEYAKAITAFSRQRNLPAARAIFEDLVSSQPEQIDTFACRAMIDAYKAARFPNDALRTFERMQGWGVKPNEHIYHSLLHAFVLERSSRFELLGVREAVLQTCLRLFKQMKAEGLEPDSVTYTILMTIFGAAAQPELAWGVYQELRQKVQQEGSEVVLTQRQYGAILTVLVEGKEVEKAFEVKDDMEAAGLGLDRISWCLLIRACTQVDQVFRAFTVFDEMVQSGCPPCTEAYNVLINACAVTGLEERAWALLDEMKAGGPNRAEGTDCAPDIVTYNTMLKVCYAQPERAKDILEEIAEEGLRPNIRTFNCVIDIYAQKQDAEGARKVFNEMKEAGLRPNVVTYTSLMDALMKCGDMDGAMDVLKEMKVAGLQPNKATYTVLLRVRPEWKLHYDVQRGLRLYEEMRAAGFAPNDSDFKELMNRWAEEQMQAKAQQEETKSLHVEKVTSNQTRPPMFLDLVMRKGSSEAAQTEELTIDLHGLSRPEARAAVLSLLRTLQLRHVQGWKIQSDLTIITGRGIGSRITGIPVVRTAVLNLLREELGFPVIAWEPSPDLDDLNLETLNLRSTGARALISQKDENDVSSANREQVAKKGDPAQELMAEAITTIAGHNEVEVNSLLVHGLGKPGVMKPISGYEQTEDGEAVQQAREELADALSKIVEEAKTAEASTSDDSQSQVENTVETSFGWSLDEMGRNRYFGNDSQADSESDEEESSSENAGLPPGFEQMPLELRERQMQRMRDAERWRQLEEELYYLGPYGQRLLYTRRKLKNQGRIVVPKDALMEWVEGRRKHGRQRRRKEVGKAK